MSLFLMQVLLLNTQIWNSCEFSDVKFRKSLERGTLIWMVMWELANMETIEVINQVWDTVFHHQMKHWEESWKYDCSRVFLTNFEVFPVSNAWYYFSNKMILEGEIKDAKMSSFSSDFQTLIKLYFLCIFFMNY